MKHEEEHIQCDFIKWFRMQYPSELIFAIPNGGKRNMLEAVRLKRQGVIAGVPDLFIAKSNEKYNGLFIEMKSEKGKKSPNQIAISNTLEIKGYKVEFCNSLSNAIKQTKDYFNNSENKRLTIDDKYFGR